MKLLQKRLQPKLISKCEMQNKNKSSRNVQTGMKVKDWKDTCERIGVSHV